jgi:hypothetical protein
LNLVNGATINSWPDVTGIYSATSGTGPLFTTGYVGTFPAAVFSSGKSLTISPSITCFTTTTWTVVAVIKSGEGNVMGHSVNNYQMRYNYPSGKASMYNGSSSLNADSFSTTAGQPLVVWFLHTTGGNGNFFENATGRGGGGWTTYGAPLNWMGNTSYNGPLNGGIAELCVFSSDMTANITDLFNNYFHLRYGVF